MDPKALFKITYGLYLLTTRQQGEDNGCIINTVMQIAEKPDRLAVAVSKRNLSCSMLQKTGAFNISTLTTKADLALFRRFGMQSGRDADKFAGFAPVERTENGIYRLTEMTNAFLSGRVVDQLDLGTHILFVAEVVDGQVLSGEEPCTYSYYQENIKPKPAPAEKKGWVCEVCGYVYEGGEPPEGYVCPVCQHGREVFRPVGEV